MLASINSNDPEQIAKMLRRALAKWESLPRDRRLLADAICVRNHPVLTFWRRLSRDLRERRKPPWVLVRRGWKLMRQEPEVVAHAVALGCEPMRPEAAYQRIRALVTAS